MCLPGNIHLGIRADTQVRPGCIIIIDLFHTGKVHRPTSKRRSEP